jgi:hypothetical protein
VGRSAGYFVSLSSLRTADSQRALFTAQIVTIFVEYLKRAIGSEAELGLIPHASTRLQPAPNLPFGLRVEIDRTSDA